MEIMILRLRWIELKWCTDWIRNLLVALIRLKRGIRELPSKLTLKIKMVEIKIMNFSRSNIKQLNSQGLDSNTQTLIMECKSLLQMIMTLLNILPPP